MPTITVWLQTMGIDSLTVLRVRGLPSRCQQCCPPSRGSISCPCRFWWLLTFLDLQPWGFPTLSSASGVHGALCVLSLHLSQFSPCLSLTWTLVVGLSHPDNPGRIHFKIPDLITLAKTPFANSVISTGFRDLWMGRFSGGWGGGARYYLTHQQSL